MKVLLIGEENRRLEMVKCLPENTETIQADIAYEVDLSTIPNYDVVFDLNADEDTYLIDEYPYEKPVTIIASAVKSSLAEMIEAIDYEGGIYGMNCLPTFINRPLKEVSVYNTSDVPKLRDLMEKLGWEYQLVNDRVGMVTPRVVCMIINEACFTVQEGTANIVDIDKSMKLGTAYPYGPFKWADKIGVKDVYEVIEALYADTGDERYKICPMLKNHYLKDKTFY
ncbi:MAG: 3-hydroxyacyl-CoA dehydrogenase family protein [Bacteroidia bacterium]